MISKTKRQKLLIRTREGWGWGWVSGWKFSHPSTHKQFRFEIDIERLYSCEQPRKKKVYGNLDARLVSIALSYDVNDTEQYLIRIAINFKKGTWTVLSKFYLIFSSRKWVVIVWNKINGTKSNGTKSKGRIAGVAGEKWGCSHHHLFIVYLDIFQQQSS
jgi:hypothetical protein